MKMEQTECSETSAYKIQTPGNYQEGNTQHTEQDESLKSRIILFIRSKLVINYQVSCNWILVLTLTLLTWKIWWALNNASRWQMGFHPAFKGLKTTPDPQTGRNPSHSLLPLSEYTVLTAFMSSSHLSYSSILSKLFLKSVILATLDELAVYTA